jgi:hypothetical protein
MKHIKQFEAFDWLRKKGSNDPKNWKGKFDYIYSVFLDKKKGKYPNYKINVSVDEDNFSVSELDFNKKMSDQINLLFQKDNLIVTDFQDWDEDDPQNKKDDHKITKSEYDQYLKKAVEIDKWLDDQSDEEIDSKKSKVGDTGEVDLKFSEVDLLKDEVNDKLKEYLNKYIGKSFEFELDYTLWTGASTNEKVNVRKNLRIDDIEFEFVGRLRVNVYTKDPFNNKKSVFTVYEEDLEKCEYYDFSKIKLPDFKKIFIMHVEDELENQGRRKEKYKWKNRKYPYVFSYEMTPSKYNTIEFLKFLVEILRLFESERD